MPSPAQLAGLGSRQEREKSQGRVVRLAADLVDLVDVDDAALRPLDVVVRGLEQLEDDVLHILTHITRFGQRVASAMVKGTSKVRASVWASRVLPEPVGPTTSTMPYGLFSNVVHA